MPKSSQIECMVRHHISPLHVTHTRATMSKPTLKLTRYQDVDQWDREAEFPYLFRRVRRDFRRNEKVQRVLILHLKRWSRPLLEQLDQPLKVLDHFHHEVALIPSDLENEADFFLLIMRAAGKHWKLFRLLHSYYHGCFSTIPDPRFSKFWRSTQCQKCAASVIIDRDHMAV